MHLILTGATGLIGSGVLDAMVRMKEVTKISIISRRPVKMADDAKDPRINVIIHKNFESYDAELLDKVRDATGCVWARKEKCIRGAEVAGFQPRAGELVPALAAVP